PVEPRSRDAAEVAQPTVLLAPTGTWRAAGPTWTRVHGRDEEEASRVVDRGPGARDPDDAFLQRLARAGGHGATELRQLVEKEDATVGATHFAWAHGGRATADHRHRGRRVM